MNISQIIQNILIEGPSNDARLAAKEEIRQKKEEKKKLKNARRDANRISNSEPETQAAETPKTQTAETPKTQAAKTLKTQTAETPKTQAAETPKTQTVETPKTQTVETPTRFAAGKAKLAGHIASGKAKYGEQIAKYGKKKVYGAAGLVGLAGAGGAYGAYRGLKSALTKTPSEKAHAMAGSVKDVIKNKIMEHPKTAAALGAAGVIGTGYGAYRYLKGRKKK